MIRYTRGDLLSDDAEALVNAVNCVGVMGAGIALHFKKKFPANFEAYAEACERGEVRPGRMFVFETGEPTPPRYIVNFPTKRHWKDRSRLEDIDAGLESLVGFLQENRVESIALPALGAGLGGFDWAVVRDRIEEALSDVEGVRIVVYEPR